LSRDELRALDRLTRRDPEGVLLFENQTGMRPRVAATAYLSRMTCPSIDRSVLGAPAAFRDRRRAFVHGFSRGSTLGPGRSGWLVTRSVVSGRADLELRTGTSSGCPAYRSWSTNSASAAPISSGESSCAKWSPPTVTSV
jgi:hypothetical protein